MFYFDPMYLILVGPALLLALWAQMRVKSVFAHYSQVPASSGVSGAEAASQMLRTAGIQGVRVERADGFLSDHYDPAARLVRLSPEVYDGHSIASLGVACHEVGHAIQHSRGYAPLAIRNLAVPLAGFGAQGGVLLFMAGLTLSWFGLAFGTTLAWIGVFLFAGVVAFQIINLPVEFNASSRAKEMLGTMGLVRPGAEAAGVSSVLGAAAMTYVAGTVQSLMQLIYFIMLLTGNRRQN